MDKKIKIYDINLFSELETDILKGVAVLSADEKNIAIYSKEEAIKKAEYINLCRDNIDKLHFCVICEKDNGWLVYEAAIYVLGLVQDIHEKISLLDNRKMMEITKFIGKYLMNNKNK